MYKPHKKTGITLETRHNRDMLAFSDGLSKSKIISWFPLNQSQAPKLFFCELSQRRQEGGAEKVDGKERSSKIVNKNWLLSASGRREKPKKKEQQNLN